MPSILHLEDDTLDHKLVRAVLAREGLADDLSRVDDAHLYREAISTRTFDLILADYNLVGFDGMAALKVAGEVCGGTPFILLSGAIGETAAVEILKAGATDVVLKDRLERLVPAIRRALREAADRRARQEAEDRLRSSEARLRLMLESVRDYAILSTDPQGLITSWNVGAERIFGYPEAQIVGRHVSELFTEPDRHKGIADAELRQAVENGSTSEERLHQRLDGTQFFASCVITPVYDGGRALRGFTKVARDVTEQRLHDQELRRARDVAEAASQAKDHFLAVLSHELRTPLTPVLTAAQMMERDLTVPDAARDVFAMIRRNVELEARLIDDLLDLTRISRGKMEFHFSSVDAHEKVRQVIQMCMDDARAKGVSLTEALDSSCVFIRADGARLQQVAWNLVKNAIKFTPAGGSIVVRTHCGDEGTWVLEVSDTGVGVDPSLLQRLFEPFEQGGKDVTRLFGGLGLGLTISRAIVESHNGSIEVFSPGAGQGTTVRVTLPTIEPPASLKETAPRIDGSAARTSVVGTRVLLVEDNTDTAGVMAMVLQMSGFEVRIANSVAAALKSAAADPPDVLVSDIGLPDGSGLDLMRQLRNIRPVRGIALSGYGQEEDVRRSREAGFLQHLTKPVDLDTLDAAVKQLVQEPM